MMKKQPLKFNPNSVSVRNNPPPDRHIEIWTDGGTTHNGKADSFGGWSFVAMAEDKPVIGFSNQVPGCCTNNRCEIMGVIAALITYGAQGVKLTIKSDSEYVVKTVNQWRLNWHRKRHQSSIKNKSLFEKLFHLVDTNNVKLEWVRGHSGILGNEIADKWATNAMHGKKPTTQQLEAARFIYFDSIVGLNDEQGKVTTNSLQSILLQ